MKIANKKKGFTLIETLVVSSIVLVVLGVVFSSYPKFRDRTALSSLARRVGLLVRETQVFGLAVREFPSGVEIPQGVVDIENFPPYGISISMLNPDEIIVFADVNALQFEFDRSFQCGITGSECVRKSQTTQTEYISDICVANEFSPDGLVKPLCSAEGVSELNITFRRPDPEAYIMARPFGTLERYNAAEIHLASARVPNETKVVRIWISGQISID